MDNRNNLKNREFDKDAAQILESGASDIVQEQGASEDPKFIAKLTPSKTDSSSCFGVDILSLFPDYFRGPFDVSILKRAREKGLIQVNFIDIRDFAEGKHRKVDDRPYGGGPGMVMMPGPSIRAIRDRKRENSHVVYMSPQGKTLNAKKCAELASYNHLIILCGHYEGIDQRIIESEVDEEISIGDYVLTNGCLPAIVLALIFYNVFDQSELVDPPRDFPPLQSD